MTFEKVDRSTLETTMGHATNPVYDEWWDVVLATNETTEAVKVPSDSASFDVKHLFAALRPRAKRLGLILRTCKMRGKHYFWVEARSVAATPEII